MTRAEQQARKAQQERMRQVERRHKEAARGQMDLPFLILTLLLTAIGLIMLFSASFPRAYYDTGDGTYYFKRQAIFAVIGLVAMFVVSKINYQRWRGAGRLLVGLALFLLILVIIPHNPLAITSNRATRWLGIRGVFQFQPRRSPSWRSSSTSPTPFRKSGRRCSRGGRAYCPMWRCWRSSAC